MSTFIPVNPDINNLYKAILGRNADLAGAQFYEHKLATGESIQQIANEILGEPEAKNLHLGTYDFIAQVYQQVDNRHFGIVEMGHYGSQIDSKEIDKAHFVADILCTAETQIQIIAAHNSGNDPGFFI